MTFCKISVFLTAIEQKWTQLCLRTQSNLKYSLVQSPSNSLPPLCSHDLDFLNHDQKRKFHLISIDMKGSKWGDKFILPDFEFDSFEIPTRSIIILLLSLHIFLWFNSLKIKSHFWTLSPRRTGRSRIAGKTDAPSGVIAAFPLSFRKSSSFGINWPPSCLWTVINIGSTTPAILWFEIRISTNRPLMPHSRVGWSLESFQKEFWRNSENVLLWLTWSNLRGYVAHIKYWVSHKSQMTEII